MNESERLVEKYLQSLDSGPVVFEPDGNIPPDFSVAGELGVEVRRLNQNYHVDGERTEGLEQLAIPLWQRVEKYFPSIGPSVNGESWYISIIFRRPQAPWKSIEPVILRELSSFMTAVNRTATTLRISDNLKLKLRRAGKDHGTFFVLGASVDCDAGGWVLSEVEKNLRLCVLEKSRKISAYRSKYESWWLVLVDHIALGVSENEQERFRAGIATTIEFFLWDKIILVDPRNHRRTFEIWPKVST